MNKYYNFIRQQVEKSQPQTFEELDQAIDKIMDMLNEKDLTKYFRHCYEYIPKGKNREYCDYIDKRNDQKK